MPKRGIQPHCSCAIQVPSGVIPAGAGRRHHIDAAITNANPTAPSAIHRGMALPPRSPSQARTPPSS